MKTTTEFCSIHGHGEFFLYDAGLGGSWHCPECFAELREQLLSNEAAEAELDDGSLKFAVIDDVHIDREVLATLARWASTRNLTTENAIQMAICFFNEHNTEHGT